VAEVTGFEVAGADEACPLLGLDDEVPVDLATDRAPRAVHDTERLVVAAEEDLVAGSEGALVAADDVVADGLPPAQLGAGQAVQLLDIAAGDGVHAALGTLSPCFGPVDAPSAGGQPAQSRTGAGDRGRRRQGRRRRPRRGGGRRGPRAPSPPPGGGSRSA
jgi:hypothetical protein